MKKKILVLSTLALVLSANLRAQVTIGALTAPTAGALLDLNRGATGGLLLSNVALPNLSVIPANTFVNISTEQDTNKELVGMIVYNTDATTGIGIYVWDGYDWIKPCAPPAPEAITFSGTTICGTTFTAKIDSVKGATSYEWTLPQGLTGTSGDTIITITGAVGTYPAGSITVRAVSSCGGGTRRESALPVTLVAPLATPWPITFSETSFCGASTFTAEVAPVAGATSYDWTLPNGLSFVGASNSATITISGAVGTYPAGSISVQAKNSFCSSSPRNSESEIVIGAVPAAPTNPRATKVSGNDFKFEADPVSGCVIDWYTTETGGSSVSTGDSFTETLTATKTYYAESRNLTTGCVSTSRLAVEAVVLRSVSDCDATHSVITSANVDFINDDEYERHGITLSAPVKIVGRGAKTSLSSTSNSLVDYRDHQVSASDPTNDTDDYGSWFTWCMVVTHADILCPSPWRVPSKDDFANYAGTSGTTTVITAGTHESPGVDGWLLGGYASGVNSVVAVGEAGRCWSSTKATGIPQSSIIYVDSDYLNVAGVAVRYFGMSLRCVK